MFGYRSWRFNYKLSRTKTFHKNRGDTLPLIIRRIKDFLSKADVQYSYTDKEITKFAQMCMSRKCVDIEYR